MNMGEIAELKSTGFQNILGNDEAAAFLGLSADTLPRWRWAGKGPTFVKIGRSVRYRLSDLETYLMEHSVAPRGG